MNKAMKTIVYFSVAMLLLATEITAATCRSDINASTPDQDFKLGNDGTVMHKRTGLMWMRCSLGQTWDGSSCTGTQIAFTWQNALVAAKNDKFAGYSDWRLPNKNELQSLVELSCVTPSINSMAFPNTRSRFWTSSPEANVPTYAWFVSFDGGSVATESKSYPLLVRLVRAGQ